MRLRIEYYNLEVVMNDFGKDYVTAIKRELRSEGKVASGELLNSINYKLIRKDDGFDIQITSKEYLKYVDEGRRPGRMPPSTKLIPWVRSKGIKMSTSKGKKMTDQQMAFVLAKSIGKKGIKATNILSETKAEVMAEYKDKISEAVAKDIKEYIKNNLT